MKATDQKILDFVDENKPFLSANNIDVSHSLITGDWFVYKYNSEYGYYDYYIQFKTVQQLVNFILNEFKFELYCAIDKEPDVPPFENGELADLIERYSSKSADEVLPELTALLKYIKTTDLGKDSEFFKELDKLFKKSSYKKAKKG